MNKSQFIVVVGALGLIVAAFLPWISSEILFGMDRGIDIGWEGDGYITGGIGAIILIFSFTSKRVPGRRFSILGAILGILVCLAIFADFMRIVQIAPKGRILASTDIGLYLTFVGGLAVILGSLLSLYPLNVNSTKTA